ncbi:MAG: choice-of-anchor R domain-containing protein [Candidatus Micrarchaeia archaeon]
MRYLAIFLLAAVLLFGCTGGGTGTPKNGTTAGPGPLPGPSGGPEECKPSYSFSDPQDGVTSMTSSITATVTCAAGKSIVLKLDGKEAASATPDTNATEPLKLEYFPSYDGTIKLTVESDGDVVYSRDLKVVPLGNEDTKGLDYDSVSFKEWRAMAFDVGNDGIKADKVRIFMKRIDFRTQPSTNIVVELRKDQGGKPGSVVSSVTRPITVTTLSDNWITFDFQDNPSLAKGRYWVVMRVEQTEEVNLISDKINVHFAAGDRQTTGNDYTKEMLLSLNEQTGIASETQWQPLSYDRSYNVVLYGAK